MPETKTPRGKGKELNKKVGPFPVYYWLLGGVAIVILYIYYRKRQAAAGGPGSQNQQIIPSGVVVPPQTGTGDVVTPSGTTTTSGDGATTLPSDYLTQTDFDAQIAALEDAQAKAIAGITFPKPDVTVINNIPKTQATTAKSKTAAKTHHATSTAKARIRYYKTRKAVPLKKGQHAHFLKGHGWYAGK